MSNELSQYLMQASQYPANFGGWGLNGPTMASSAPVNFLSAPSDASLFSPADLSQGWGSLAPNGVAPGPTPTMGKIGNWLSNGNNLGTVVQGIGALTSAYLGYQQLKQAKAALGFQKEAFAKNFGNQVATYNTSLEDRIRGRTSDYAGKEQDVQAYLARHSLKK
jgi:hypothetical protein